MAVYQSNIQHNADYVLAAESGGFLYYQPHILHTLTVFVAGGDNINSCGVDAAVTKNICELCNILFDTIESAGEQVAQIVWKNLLRIYSCLLTKAFHFPPNVSTARWLTGAGYEYCT